MQLRPGTYKLLERYVNFPNKMLAATWARAV